MFIIPMVGLSSRFFQDGFNVPKYQLSLNNSSVFTHALRSFESYFKEDNFLFLVRNEYSAESFVNSEILKLGISNARIITFSHNTEGQADTVFQGTKGTLDNEELYIFNIDTFRPNFRKPPTSTLGDGYIEVFQGDGDNWSFVLPGLNNKVLRTAEKDRISNLCSSGLYYFREKKFFDEAYNFARANEQRTRGEYYIAPLYNHLIYMNKVINYGLINRNDVIFCGTPAEFRKLKKEDY